MKELLSKSDFQILQLLEYLVNNSRTTFSDISQNLGISVRTTNIYLDEINSKYYPIKVTRDKHFVTIIIPSNYSISYIYSVTLLNSTEFNLINFCFFEKKVSYKKAEEILFISNATLKRKIKKINTFLLQYDFKIDSRTLRFTGNETSIINFFTHYIYEAYPIKKNGFKKMEYVLIQKAILAYSKKQNVELHGHDLNNATVIVLLLFYRKKFNTHNLESLDSLDLLSSNGLIDKKITQIFFSNNYIVNVFSILKKLQQKTIFTDYSHFINESTKNSELKIAREKFVNILNDICVKFSIKHPINQDKIILDLCTNYNLNYGKPFIFFDKHHQFIQQMKKKIPELICFLTSEFYFYFKKMEEYELNSYLYLLLTHWIELTSIIEKKKNKIKISLIFDTDIEHISMLRHDISFRLYNQCIIDIPPLSELEHTTYLSNNYDLVITNISGIEVEHTKVICFSMYPSISDWIEIIELYYKN